MAESGGVSSEKGSKRKKLADKEDRLSALPDSIIHHVLSFLPSTKEMIRTGVLSKRWLHQWTRVPVVIFDFSDEYGSSEFNHTEFSLYIDSSLILYDCSKLRKFHLEIECGSGYHDRELRFASMRNVEELILNFLGCFNDYKLPKFLFTNTSLVRLDVRTCRFVSDLKVNFESLKSLKIEYCTFDDGVIENVICGSPLLESLELSDCLGFEHLVIDSKSLKCLFLIAEFSASLIEIECPKLEEMELYLDLDNLHALTFRSKLPCLKSAILEHAHIRGHFDEDSAKKLLRQFPQAEDLRIGGEFLKAALREGGLSAPLNSKSLTLVCDNFEKHLPEIKYALCNSPLMGKLVIELPLRKAADYPPSDNFEETFLNPMGNGYACLVSHLKTVKIDGLCEDNHEAVLPFVQFLLKKAGALEKMALIIRDEGTEFLAEVSQKLLKFTRCSPLCFVECYRRV